MSYSVLKLKYKKIHKLKYRFNFITQIKVGEYLKVDLKCTWVKVKYIFFPLMKQEIYLLII